MTPTPSQELHHTDAQDARVGQQGATLLLALTVVLGLDLMSKRWAQQVLGPFDTPSTGVTVQLGLSYNRGLLFGILDERSMLVIGMHTAALGVASALALTALRLRRFPEAIVPLGLILGGGLGNLTDRLTDGQVTDFIAVAIGSQTLPAFNVADMAVGLGVGLGVWALVHRCHLIDLR